MKNPIPWVFVAVVAIAIGAGLYVWRRPAQEVPPVPQAAQRAIAPPPEAAPAPQVRFPVAQDGVASQPALEQSDSVLRESLAALFGRKAFEALFSQTDIVRRIVATVDNLPRQKAAQRLMPVNPAAGPFLVTGGGKERAIATENAARYLPYVALAESVNTAQLVAAYVHHYPLFQQAYRELGYPSGYFNDRLVQVIDHLLAAPEPQGPLKVVQPKVLYEFADPELEARSAGEKIMLRIGAGNSARIKARLRDVRRALTDRMTKP